MEEFEEEFETENFEHDYCLICGDIVGDNEEYCYDCELLEELSEAMEG